MRPPIKKEEVELLMQDMEMLAEQYLGGLEAFEALRLLEMRRQTGNMEAIKRLISYGKEWGNKPGAVAGLQVLLYYFIDTSADSDDCRHAQQYSQFGICYFSIYRVG